MFDDLTISLAECRDKLMDADKYGYGLDRRKIKKYLPYNRELFNQHRATYYFYLDLYTWKLMRGQGFHAPISIMEPRWEQEIAYDWWIGFFSYAWRGAKHNG